MKIILSIWFLQKTRGFLEDPRLYNLRIFFTRRKPWCLEGKNTISENVLSKKNSGFGPNWSLSVPPENIGKHLVFLTFSEVIERD